MATKGIKLSKSTEKEIDRIYDLLNDLNRLKEDIVYKNWDNIDKSEYEVLNIKDKDPEEALEYILKFIDGASIRKAIFNLSTLLENCADPECDTLEFNKDIKRGLELLELEKQDKLLISL